LNALKDRNFTGTGEKASLQANSTII